MTNIYYGIRRLLILNTANYSLGDFPLDRPLSISAPNNRGKSTAINALQFPFLSHMNDMSFPRSNEETRKYYFPYENSYVVSEIVTETGTYIVGAVGKGQASGYEYQLFACHTKLNISDFLVSDNEKDGKQVRNYKELMNHLAKRDVWVKSLHPKQMRDALMGKTITLSNDEKFTIGIFRLRSMTDVNYRLFIRVFKNLLHMNNLNLEEMKRLLIDVLLPGEGSSTIDFMSRYRILNEEVESAKAKVDTAAKIAPDVIKLEEAKNSNDEAYGVLRALFSQITTAFDRERQKRESEINNIRNELASIKPRVKDLKNSQKPLQDSMQEFSVKENKLKTKIEEIEKGEIKFALYNSVEQVKQKIIKMRDDLELLIVELKCTKPEDIKDIESDINEVSQGIINYTARMSAIDNNLLSVLTKHFGESQIQIVAKLLNRDLISLLPVGDSGIDILDEKKLYSDVSELLSKSKNGYYNNGSIRVNLEKIPQINIDDYFNHETIKKSIDRLKKRKKELERDLDVARDYEKMKQKKEDLEKDIKIEENNLNEYENYLSAKKGKEKLEKDYVEIKELLKKVKEDQAGIIESLIKLSEEEQKLNQDKNGKEAALNSLSEKYQKVVPVTKSEPLGKEPTYRLPSILEEMIDTYLLALETKRTTKESIEKYLALIEGKNGLRFTSGQDEEVTIRELVEAIKGKDEYIKQRDNCQKAVSQEIGALLKGLTDRLDNFDNEIKLFNRQINSRKISNIKSIKFIVDDNNNILRAIKEIVNQDSIFSEPDNVHRAVKQLDDLISKKNIKLSLENLFNMGIEVELESGKVTTSFNDANIQSTGTGLTVKVILNVMLLNRLLFIKNGQVINIPIYIDEAGQIDPDNQITLIDQCLPAGFIPVFASVEAQATADYWIGLNEVGGRIYVDQEDWFRLSKKEGNSEVVTNA